MGFTLLLLVTTGCSRPAPKPGVTYQVSVLTLESNGRLVPQGAPTRVESATVQHTQELTHNGQSLALLVRKTEYGRATFDVTFPDKEVQMVRVKTGETKDVLRAEHGIGLRIEVQDCH